MASSSGAHRAPHVTFRSIRELGESLTRILKLEATPKPATAVAGAQSPRGAVDAGESSGSNICSTAPGATRFKAGADLNSSHSKTAGGPFLNDASFVRASLASCDLATMGVEVAGGNQDSGGVSISRLDESEGWFIADLIGGRNEKEDSAVSEGESRHGSLVMVSSVNSVSSMDRGEEEGLQVGEDALNMSDSACATSPLLSSQMDNDGKCTQHCDKFTLALEGRRYQRHWDEVDEAALFAEERDAAIFASQEALLRLPGQRAYMINGGHGWNIYPTLQALLDFLREHVNVFGATALRSTRFYLPVSESGEFLDELEKIAPHTWHDYWRAAEAAATPIGVSFIARYCMTHFAELFVSWGAGAVAEGSAATTAAAVAGETVTVAGTAATVAGSVGVISLVIVAGASVYAVVRFVNELRQVRSKVIVITADSDLERGQATSVEHCLIKWK